MQGSGTHRTVRSAHARARGFTLIELMVVVVIVSILMAIALPGYSLYLKKSRRGDAEATLMDIAQREQQYLNDARAYAPDPVTLNGGGAGLVPTDVSTFYNVTINAPAGATPPTFVVTATPIATSPQAGDYTLTLDQAGVRGPAAAW
jgi:type IV pilus assembly protein PilE